MSVFAEPPNATWTRNRTTGLYNTAAVSITDNEITNNFGFVKRWSCAETMRMTRICSYIPDEVQTETKPIGYAFNPSEAATVE